MQLEQFIQDCEKHESQFVEFKQPARPFLTWEILDSALESVCAMANTYGGKVVIGVEDEDGAVVAWDGFVSSYGGRDRHSDPAQPYRMPGR